MHHAIACALRFVRALLTSGRPGRHSAAHLNTHPTSAPVAAPALDWPKPATDRPDWNTVDFDPPVVRPFMNLVTQRDPHQLQRERRVAAVLAGMGIDYDYPGAPYPASAFDTTNKGVSA